MKSVRQKEEKVERERKIQMLKKVKGNDRVMRAEEDLNLDKHLFDNRVLLGTQ